MMPLYFWIACGLLAALTLANALVLWRHRRYLIRMGETAGAVEKMERRLEQLEQRALALQQAYIAATAPARLAEVRVEWEKNPASGVDAAAREESLKFLSAVERAAAQTAKAPEKAQ